MSEILQSYLVTIGFSPDANSFGKFQQVLKDTDSVVSRYTSGMVQTILKTQLSIVGAFTAISGAIVGMVDKVAMADQSYRLFALRMLMTQESGRKLKLITEGLGASLEEIIWDSELHSRAVQMSADIDRMTANLGPDFETKMLRIRDIRFEFTRLSEALKFLGMQFVGSLFGKFDTDIDTIQNKVHSWVEWLIQNTPKLADQFATYLTPVLKQTWQIFKDIGGAISEFSLLFTNIVGLLSGDTSIEGSTVNLEKMATALSHVAGFAAMLVHYFTLALRSVTQLANALVMLASGNIAGAIKEFKSGLGGLSEAVSLNPNNLINTVIGNMIGGSDQSVTSPTTGSVEDVIRATADKYGVSQSLMLAVAKQESNFNQSAISRTGALGVMQLMPSTAHDLGVNPYDTTSNIEGGTKYIAQLLQHYHGNEQLALAVRMSVESSGTNHLSAILL